MAHRPSSTVEELRALAYASIPSRSRRDHLRSAASQRKRRSRLDAEEGEIFSDDDALANTEAQAKDTKLPKNVNTNLAEASKSSHGRAKGNVPVPQKRASLPKRVLEEPGSPVSNHNKKQKQNPPQLLSATDTIPSSANTELTKRRISEHPAASTCPNEINHRRSEIPSSNDCHKTMKHLGIDSQNSKTVAELQQHKQRISEDNCRNTGVASEGADTVDIPASMFETSDPTSGNRDVYSKSVEVQGPYVTISPGSVLSFESVDHRQKLCNNPYQSVPVLKHIGVKGTFEARPNATDRTIYRHNGDHSECRYVRYHDQQSYPNMAANQDGISGLHQWKEEENLVEKEVEEAQQHRHDCEVRERLVRRQYHDAHGALQSANMRCDTLYQKREMISARILNERLKGSFSAPSGYALANVVPVMKVMKQQGSLERKNDGGTFEPTIVTKKDEQNQATSLHQHEPTID